MYRIDGKILRDRLIEKGWTQSELARRTGITPRIIGLYIRGKQRAFLVNVGKISKTLEIPLEELIVDEVA